MSYSPSAEHPLTTASPYFPAEEQAWLQAELAQILDGKLAMGPRVTRFEQEFAGFCGAEYGVAFPSGTASLESALLALGTQSGDEVLVPVETFAATGMAIHLVGGRPVFTEISADTFSMDFDDAWSRVTDRTRGAIVVHFGGLVAPRFPEFTARMRSTGRFVVEDAAHAHGARLNGRRAGAFADAGCFSFHSTKIMTTGEGGMVVTSNPRLAERARSLQNRGADMSSAEELYLWPGRNNRFTEIAAAMGLSQLRCLNDFLERRHRIAAIYDRRLAAGDLFRPLAPGTGVPSYWRYVAVARVPLDRRRLKAALAADSIVIDWPYDPALHLQPVARHLFGTKPGMFPRSEDLMAKHICLPVNARMRDIDAEYVADRLTYHAAQSSLDARVR